MPRPGVAIEGGERRKHLRPEGIQVEIADEFQEIRLLLHHDGLVPILKEMAGPVVPPVEGPGVPGEEAPHAAGERAIPRADQQVGMIREEGPGVDGEGALLRQARPGGRRSRARSVSSGRWRGARARAPSHGGACWGIQAGLAGHGTGALPQAPEGGNVPYSQGQGQPLQATSP